jgi:hypothetical protein
MWAGIGTLLFVLITGNRVPSYTGSSLAFIAPVLAAKAHGGIPAALGGIVCAGLALFVVGLLIDRVGYRVVEFLLPPVVTGAIVALIGLNLAPVAKDEFSQQAGIALFTLASILLFTVGLRGLAGQMSVFLGVAAGYVFAAVLGKVDWSAVHEAAWFGWGAHLGAGAGRLPRSGEPGHRRRGAGGRRRRLHAALGRLHVRRHRAGDAGRGADLPGAQAARSPNWASRPRRPSGVTFTAREPGSGRIQPSSLSRPASAAPSAPLRWWSCSLQSTQ